MQRTLPLWALRHVVRGQLGAEHVVFGGLSALRRRAWEGSLGGYRHQGGCWRRLRGFVAYAPLVGAATCVGGHTVLRPWSGGVLWTSGTALRFNLLGHGSTGHVGYPCPHVPFYHGCSGHALVAEEQHQLHGHGGVW